MAVISPGRSTPATWLPLRSVTSRNPADQGYAMAFPRSSPIQPVKL
jgi:hypothetical protein